MNIDRRKIRKINSISRKGFHSKLARKRLFGISQSLVDRLAGDSRGKRLLLDDSKMYMRKDENEVDMSFYFKESRGGCIVLNLHYGMKEVHMMHRSKAEEYFSTNCDLFSRSRKEFAEKYLGAPVSDRIVFRPANPRPLDNLLEIVAIADECISLERNGKRINLFPNFESTVFSPDRIFDAAGMDFQFVDEKFAENSHVISVLDRFSGWKKHMDLVHRAYGADMKKDHSKILITLDVEKRIWAEQDEGISGFLTRAREYIGTPLTVAINGMTAAVNGNRFGAFDEIDAEENAIIRRIRRNSPSDTRFLRGFGKTIEEKLEMLKDFGFYIGPFGSSSIISTVLNIPGITYQNRYYINKTRKAPNIRRRIKVPARFIRNIEGNEGIAANVIEHFAGQKCNPDKLSGYSINLDKFRNLSFRHYKKVVSLNS